MKIRLIGLGRMGLNMALNMQENGHEVLGFAKTQQTRQKANDFGLKTAKNIEELFENRENKVVVWLLVPHTEVEGVLNQISPYLKKGDIVIDAGNSNFNVSIQRYNNFKQKEIFFLDMGTSGGVKGAREGACLFVGGDKKAYEYVEEVVKDVSAKNSCAHSGEAGSGHLIKMVHNAVEYGIMQAIGEGFELLSKMPYDLNFKQISCAWSNGSMLKSVLMDCVYNAFKNDEKLENIEGKVDDSGTGKWMVEEALKAKVSMPVITNSVFTRFKSKDEDMFAEKVVAAIRKEFGGHTVYKKK